MSRGPLGLPRLTNVGPYVEESVSSNVRLINGNSIDILEKLNYNKDVSDVDAIITDPPYGVDIGSSNELLGSIRGDGDIEQAVGIYKSVINEATDLLTEGAPLLSFSGDQSLCEFQRVVTDENYDVLQVLIWDKNTGGTPFGSPRWRYSYEMVIYASYGKPSYINSNASDRDVLRFPAVPSNQYSSRVHTAQNPVKLMEYLIESVTEPGDVILDPFMGSGTTGVAATNMGRDFIGVEIDEEFYRTAINRIRG